MANAALPMQGLDFCVSFLSNFFISPRRAKVGGVARGMRSSGTPSPTPGAGAPPAGPCQEPQELI
jgi:hypothetical protein